MPLSSLRSTEISPSERMRQDRRKSSQFENIPAGSCFFDPKFEAMAHKINEGDYCVLRGSDDLIMTTLGSCISVCIYDLEAKVGGMNHFLLPEGRDGNEENNFCMRYGNNAMEILINEILKRGGMKDRLILKAFGAGNVLKIKADIGPKNIRFLDQYVKAEGLKLATRDLGGDLPRRVAFFPATGKAYVKLLRRASDMNIAKKETNFRKRIGQQQHAGEIELF